jgi:opacity protein-like surface antigen
MRSLALTAAVLAALCTAHVARAADDDPYNRPGGYIGIGASRSVNFFDGAIGDAYHLPPSSAEDTWGINARAGYRFNKFLATELEYEWMKNFRLRVQGFSIGRLQTQAATLNLRVVAPYGAWQPYALVGAGAIWTTLNSTTPGISPDLTTPSFAARFALGLDYYITKNLSLNLGGEFLFDTIAIEAPPELVGPNNKGRGHSYFSGQFGFGYRF